MSRAILLYLFDIQRRIHVSHDGTHHPYNLHDLPPPADHFGALSRRVIPQLKLCEYDVAAGRIDADTGRLSVVPIVWIAANEVLARNLQSPRAVACMFANPGGPIMSRSSYEANRLMDLTFSLYQPGETMAICREIFMSVLVRGVLMWVSNTPV